MTPDPSTAPAARIARALGLALSGALLVIVDLHLGDPLSGGARFDLLHDALGFVLLLWAVELLASVPAGAGQGLRWLLVRIVLWASLAEALLEPWGGIAPQVSRTAAVLVGLAGSFAVVAFARAVASSCEALHVERARAAWKRAERAALFLLLLPQLAWSAGSLVWIAARPEPPVVPEAWLKPLLALGITVLALKLAAYLHLLAAGFASWLAARGQQRRSVPASSGA